MEIDLKEFSSVPKGIKDFAIFVDHQCVGNSKTEDDFHDRSSKTLCICLMVYFAHAKSGPVAPGDKIIGIASKLELVRAL